MLEKYQNFLEKCKKNRKQDKPQLEKWDLEKVQGLFEMQDINKELRLCAINKSQLETTDKFEKTIQKRLKNLYVPDYQSENV